MKNPLAKPTQPCVVAMNGRPYNWDADRGLDPAVALEVEGFIRKLAWGYRGRTLAAGLEVEDLVQEGWTGALKAAAKFNPQAGANYLTYAAWWIEAAMKDALCRALVKAPQGAAMAKVVSFDAPVGGSTGEDTRTLLDLEPAEQPGVDELSARAEARERLLAALPRLSRRNREVLVQHLGLGGQKPLPLQAIAKRLGVSRQRVGQIIEQATLQLHLQLAG